MIGEDILRKRINLIGGGILDVNRTARFKNCTLIILMIDIKKKNFKSS